MSPLLEAPFMMPSRTASPIPSQHRRDTPSGSRAPTQPPSRSASYQLPPNRLSTPSLLPMNAHANAGSSSNLSASTTSPTSPKHEHSTKISHRLRHMFDSAKTANFEAKVVIHELGNVPQLAGEFAVSWKFRGRRPRGKEAVTHAGPAAKPSLSNLKLNQPLHSLDPSPSSSTISLNSTSTSSPATSLHSASIPSFQMPAARSSTPTLAKKSASLPVSDFTPIVPSRSPSTSRPQKTSDPPIHPPLKKASDPTPLRKSTTGPLNVIAASPEMMSREELPPSDQLHPDRAKEIAENNSSGSSAGEAPLVVLPPAVLASASGRSSANSSTSHLSMAGARSGTGPSPATILDPIPGRAEDPLLRPKSLHRSTSHGSSTQQTSTTGSVPHPLGRERSSTNPLRHQSSHSSSRKGSTPSSSLRSHTATWDYEISHVIKVPLGKPIPMSTPGTATPRIRGTAPVVGAGPFSESGLHLVIEQLPTKAAVTSQSVANDKEGLRHTLHAAHHAGKDDGKNPSERSASNADTHKTTFGVVDVDLAAFAGKGRMTRRFLLRGSRTNAVIKLSVEMRWVGGEGAWAAPPIQEGHHVTGMRDLVGAETEEKLRSDLNLAKTPSNVSSMSSTSAQSRTGSASSTANLAAATMSNVSLVGSAPPVNYKSYEHHLRPPEPPSPPSSRSSPSTMDIVRRHTHRHRTHHSRHFREPPAIQQFSMHDLSPDVVIEAVFNPHAANEDTPFTFVPDRTNRSDLEGPQAVLESLFNDTGEGAGASETQGGSGDGDGETEAGSRGGKGGKWAGLRGMRGRREKRERAVSGLSQVSGRGQGRGQGQVQGHDFAERGHGAMGMERTAATAPTTVA